LGLTGGDTEQASALLWSVKEASVKAIGCAFHMVEPRQVYVYPSVGGEGVYAFPVRVSGKAFEHLPIGAGRFICVCSLPQLDGWFSIAHYESNVQAMRLRISQTTGCSPLRLSICEGKDVIPDAFSVGV
jgi:phosphopantetheinyl transferase (holo-ACP synthase)